MRQGPLPPRIIRVLCLTHSPRTLPGKFFGYQQISNRTVYNSKLASLQRYDTYSDSQPSILFAAMPPKAKRGRAATRSTSRAMSTSRSRSRSVRTVPNSKMSLMSNFGIRNQNQLAKMWNPFPAKHVAFLRYSAIYDYSTTNAAAAPQQFRCNSIFDVDYTGVGHQPYGHDQYATIYNSYFVRKCIITAIPCVPINGRTVIVLSDDAAITNTEQQAVELKDSTAVMQTQYQSNSLRNTYDFYRMYNNLEKASCSAKFGSNPAYGPYFNLMQFGSNPTSTLTGYHRVTLEFEVEMWDLKELPAS